MAISQQSKVFQPASQPLQNGVDSHSLGSERARVGGTQKSRRKAGGIHEKKRQRHKEACLCDGTSLGRTAAQLAGLQVGTTQPWAPRQSAQYQGSDKQVANGRKCMANQTCDVSTRTHTLMLCTPADASPWKDLTHKPDRLRVYTDSGRLRR